MLIGSVVSSVKYFHLVYYTLTHPSSARGKVPRERMPGEPLGVGSHVPTALTPNDCQNACLERV